MGHSLLSKPAILANLGKGIIIEPFNPRQLRSCSYDVRLGINYFRRHGSIPAGDFLFNPYDEEMVARHYGNALQAQPAAVVFKKKLENLRGIEPDDQVIVLKPGEMILGHTEEFIGGTRDPELDRCFTAEMKARSSVGRVGFEVCRCAGWGDVGYINRWTMEIVCTSPVPTILVAGTRLAQMKFYEVDPIEWEDLYGTDSNRDSYQGSVAIEDVKAAWKPEMLLPRLKTS